MESRPRPWPPEDAGVDRLRVLETSVLRLSTKVESLEARLAALEGTASPAAEDVLAPAIPPEQPLAPGAPAAGGGFAELLPLAGRTLLVLGGAFLVRWLTDAGTLSPALGAAAGLAYAAAWALLADRRARAGPTADATVHGLSALLIGYPLIFEGGTRLHLLSPGAAASALLGFTALLFGIAWRRSLPGLAYATSISAVVAAAALLVATSAILPLTAATAAIGLACLWLCYARQWVALPWLPALVADLMVWQLTWIASRPEGPPEAYRGLSLPGAAALALAFGVLYLGSIAVRTLVRHRDVTLFEALQSAAALLLGFAGASKVLHASGPAAVAVVLGLLAYAVAFAFVERQSGRGRNFYFYTSLGLGLVLWGSSLSLGRPAAALLWCGLAIAAALLGARFARGTLRNHAVLYAWAAAVGSGLAGSAADAFLASSRPESPISVPALLSLATALACYALLASPEARHGAERLPPLSLAVLSLLGLGGLVVTLAAGWLQASPATLAAIRTAVLATAGLVLASTAARPRLLELSWLVYPLLAAGGLKLIFEDLRVGQAATLFPAFALYGLALIAAPRLLRRAP